MMRGVSRMHGSQWPWCSRSPLALSHALPIAALNARLRPADKVRSPLDVSQIRDRPNPSPPQPSPCMVRVSASPTRGGGREGEFCAPFCVCAHSGNLNSPCLARTCGFHAVSRHKICSRAFNRAGARLCRASGSQSELTSSDAPNQKLSVKIKNCPAEIWNRPRTVKQITQFVNNRAGMEAAFPNGPRRGD